jgi:hypothetical protein
MTDEQLAALTTGQRADLARRLAALPAGRGPAVEWRRRWFVTVVAGGCVLLVAWIGGLTVTLPDRYVTNNWDVAWIGLDIALLLGLAGTAWSVWRRSAAVVAFASATAVLLLCDAWFDVTTASTGADVVVGAITALMVELPVALLLLRLAHRLYKSVSFVVQS